MVTLASFAFSEKNGFLPDSDPLIRFSDPRFARWEEVSQNLPKLILSSHLHSVIEDLPPFPLDLLDSAAAEERAMLILSYLGHAYVWGATPPRNRIPAVLAAPWHAVAKQLGRPPVLSYASYALHNWRRIDPAEPIELGNICLLQNFMAGIDEEWFILIHVAIEAQAGAGLFALIQAQQETVYEKPDSVIAQLEVVERQLNTVNAILDRMPEQCDPYIYYNRVRPYIHGWKNNPALPDGVVYEGVAPYAETGQFFRGETGAQSSIIPCLDALLGIEHKDDPLKAYLLEMQDYMPPAHRALIKELKDTARLRSFVIARKANSPRLVALYNSCVTLVEQFRHRHLEYAAAYIQKQTQTSAANPTQIGTGGTPFIPYLKKHRDESGEHLIS